jgi:hypothetical protein
VIFGANLARQCIPGRAHRRDLRPPAPHPANRTLRPPRRSAAGPRARQRHTGRPDNHPDSAYSSNQSRDSRAGGRYPSLSLHSC